MPPRILRAMLRGRYAVAGGVTPPDRRARTASITLTTRIQLPPPRELGFDYAVVVESGRLAVARNFVECDREQELLLPPSLRDWPAG